MLFQKVN